jgi:hypothetical protein
MKERSYLLLGLLGLTTCLFAITMILGILAYSTEGGVGEGSADK